MIDGSTHLLGRRYGWLLASSAVSTLGDGIRFSALPLLCAAILRDPLQVAAVTAMTTVPWLLLGLPIGAVVDRTDPVRSMVAADVLRSGSLAVAAVLLLSGHLGLATLLALALLLGIGEVVFDCASFAVLPVIVSDGALETANGRLFTVQTVSRDMAGHLLGGVLFTIGRSVPLVVDAVSFGVSAIMLRHVRPDHPPATRGTSGTTVWAEAAEGVRFLLRDRVLVVLTVVGGVISAVYLGQVAVLVIHVRDELGWGPTGYATLLAIGALGGVAGGLVATGVSARLGRVATLTAGLGSMGLSGAAVATGTAVATVAGCFAFNLGLMLWNVVAVSARQTRTPTELLGRTVAAYRIVAWGAMPLGAMLFGTMASMWGTRAAFAVGAAAVLLCAAALGPALGRDPRLRGRVAGGQAVT